MEKLQAYLPTLIAVLLIAAASLFFLTQRGDTPSEDTSATAPEETVLTDDEQEAGTAGEGEVAEEVPPAAGKGVGQSGSTGGTSGDSTVSSGDEPVQTQANQQEQQEPDDPTANWKTYRNSSLGISFKVPRQWELNENSRPGEYTLQVYEDGADGKRAEFNVLSYTNVELDKYGKGDFGAMVNGREAYLAANSCAVDATCVLKEVVFPLEEKESTDDTWAGSAIRITALTHEISSDSLKNTVENILESFTITK